MDHKILEEALAKLKSENKKKFEQTVELNVSLKDVDMKKTDQQVDFYVTLSHSQGKKIKICALVGPEMAEDAKKVFDRTITQDEFAAMGKDKKVVKQLASEFDYFVAQGNIMGQVAGAFGRVLGPRGKMPNPKAGCVVAPKAALQPVYDRLTRTVRVRSRDKPMVQVAIGKENQDVKEIADNIAQVYDALLHNLPQDVNNIKSVGIKLTMSPLVKVN